MKIKKLNKTKQCTITGLSGRVEASSGHLIDALSGLLRDHGARDLVGQQFQTSLKLLAQRLALGGPIDAADHVSGWLRLISLQHPDLFTAFPFDKEVLDPVIESWHGTLSEGLDPGMYSDLNALMERLKIKLSQNDSSTVRALFIGDCLIWDIATQVQIYAHSQNFDVEPKLIAKRNGPDLRWSVKNLKPDQFDLIFYSPFTFGFSDAYASAIAPRNLHKLPLSGRRLLKDALDDARKTLGVIAQHFEGSIYVHTVSGIRQTGYGWISAAANTATRLPRRLAAHSLNYELSGFISMLSSLLNRPLLRIDEAEPLRRHSDIDLGRVLFNAGELHPTGLAHALAIGPYARACRVAALLRRRKLVVVDLDNTLWDGVIGDGPVTQYLDRQQALLRLKSKGVVLAVSSKNDPANVRWDEVALSPGDFVALEINWGRKAANILKIATTLNLNPDSFVFLDDRADERESVADVLPGILALDPNEPETWLMIEEWATTLAGAALQDRTTLYQERMARQEFLTTTMDDDPSQGYHRLELRLVLRRPVKKDMVRIVELINRTNQFNTTAARTSMAELSATDPPRNILVAEARDKFGDMGIVGALVVTMESRPVITHFVLSCRVFGYGIEDAMVQSVLRSYAGDTIAAPLVETPVNGPCRAVYANNGFNREGFLWISGESNPGCVPAWLTLDDRVNLVVP